MALDLLGIAAVLATFLLAPRLYIPLAAGIALGLGLYYLTGQTPASAAMAFGAGILGLLIGILMHATRDRSAR